MTTLNTIAAPIRSPAGLLVLEPVRHSHWPRHLLTPGTHRIGTGADNDLSIPAVGLAAGHALIRVEGSRVTLQALDRRTWVNDGPVRECVLRADDRLAIGPCLWTLRPATADDLLTDVADSAVSREESDRSAAPPEVAAPVWPAIADSPKSALVSEPRSLPNSVSSPDPIPLIESADQLLSDALRVTSGSGTVSASASNPASRPLSPQALQRLHDELQALRRELDDARTSWREETAVREIELATEATALARRGTALEQAGHELERSRQELLRSQTEIEATRTQQIERTTELRRLESRLRDYEQELIQERQRLETLVEQTRSQLVAEADQQTEAARQWETTRQRLLEDLVMRQQELEDQRRLLLGDHQTLAADRDELQLARTAFEQAAQAFEAERLEWQDRKANWEERTASTVVEQSTRQRQLDTQQQELHLLREQLAEQQAALQTARAELAEEQRELEALAEPAMAEREALAAERQAITLEREDLEREQKQLAEAQHQLAADQHTLTFAQEQWTERQQLLEQGLASASAAQLMQQEDLQRQRQELADSRQDLEQENTALQAARAALEETQRQLAEDRSRLELEQQQHAAEIAASREQLDDQRQELASQQQEFVLAQEQFQALREQLEADQAGWQQATALLDTRHDAVAAQEQNQQTQQEQESRERARWQAELQATQESLRQDRRLFAEQQTAWRQERDALWQDLAERRQRLERETLQAQDAHRRASELEQALTVDQESLRESQSELVRQQQVVTVEREEQLRAATNDQQRWLDQVRQLELLLESALVPVSRDEPVTPAPDFSADAEPPMATLPAPPATEPWLELHEFGDFSTAALTDESTVGHPVVPLRPELSHGEPEHAAVDPDWENLQSAMPTWQELSERDGDEAAADHSFNADGHLIDLPIAPAAESAESSLRAELARMFNLPESFASSPGPVEEHDSPSDRRDAGRIHGFNNEEFLSGDESAESPDEDSWKTRLNELLSGNTAPEEPGRTPELTAEFVPDHDKADVPSGSDLAAETSSRGESASVPDESDDDDSIARYMERLLARQRKPSGGNSESEVEKPIPVQTHLSRPEPAAPAPSAPRPDFVEPAEPRKRVDKSTTRAELQSMREVANLSARAALARHSWRTTRTELGIQTALAGLCTLGVMGYGSAPLWGRAIQWFPLLGCLTGALFIGFRTWQTLCKLRQWTCSIEASSGFRTEELESVVDAEEPAPEQTGE